MTCKESGSPRPYIGFQQQWKLRGEGVPIFVKRDQQVRVGARVHGRPGTPERAPGWTREWTAAATDRGPVRLRAAEERTRHSP